MKYAKLCWNFKFNDKFCISNFEKTICLVDNIER